ncbi:P-loop containing nucleoside triphosphate hydrolase protein [Chytriomyces sp. MP71]|nr:P-loop containing nucleoside triphosphate hydrolase protein [Chytriomyces sp. MP71]
MTIALSCRVPLAAPSFSVRVLRSGLASRAASSPSDPRWARDAVLPCQPAVLSPSSDAPANPDSHAKWSDFTAISQRTRNALSAHPHLERMTEVQESVLTLLFGAPNSRRKAAVTASVTVGLPDLTEVGWERKKPPPNLPTLNVSTFLDSLPRMPDLPNALGKLEPDKRLHASDLLVRSNTESGKTLAFVVAAVETILKMPKAPSKDVPILIVAPSRELAAQIQTEAKSIMDAHAFKSVLVVEGEDRAKQIKKILHQPVQVVIGTPGSLLDLMNIESKLVRRLFGLKVLIYDEADTLLDLGFLGDMTLIKKFLPPPETRQTFMFSSTFNDNLKRLAAEHMRPAHTLSLDTVSQPLTHLITKQTHIQCPFSLQPQLLLHFLHQHQNSTHNGKIIVVFQTSQLTAHLTRIFNHIPGIKVMQLHSAMDPRDRARSSEHFRAARTGILFTSDVDMRDVDYPDVTQVIQFGIPRSVDQYIHLTKCVGAHGEAILVHTSFETPFVEEALLGEAGLPLKRSVMHDPVLISRDKAMVGLLREAYAKGDSKQGSAAYSAFLGYYRGLGDTLSFTGETLLLASKEFALGLCGLPIVPNAVNRPLGRSNVRDDVEIEVPGLQDGVEGGKQRGKPKEERKWKPKHAPVQKREELATMAGTLERLAEMRAHSERVQRNIAKGPKVDQNQTNWKEKVTKKLKKKAERPWETRGRAK